MSTDKDDHPKDSNSFSIVIYDNDNQIWKTFADPDSFLEWFKSIRKDLESIYSHILSENARFPLKQLRLVEVSLNTLLSNQSSTTQHVSWDDFYNYTAQAFGYFFNDKPNLERLLAILESHSSDVAAAYLNYFNKLPTSELTADAMTIGTILGVIDDGRLKGTDFDKINASTMIATANQSKSLFDNWYSNATATAKQQLASLQQLTADVEILHNKQNNWANIFRDSARRFRRKSLKIAKREMQTIKSFYTSELALKAPIEYWNKKRKKHRNLSIAYGTLLALGLFTSVIGIVCNSDYLLNIPTTSLPVSDELTPPTTISTSEPMTHTVTNEMVHVIARFALFATLVGIAFWVLKIIYRNLLTHQHLATDASERVVMTQTYLSLASDKSIPEDGSLDFILKSLFRPASDGLIKDDKGPLPIALDLIVNKHTGD
ncbi:MAG: hypothetical protein KDA31_01365 [Phycisphaerales bacterium]|nr:hypothetical protein [Phycisphaerales bacterium]MCB9836929.1 hypothetical protein [Phycisphaera sp.]